MGTIAPMGWSVSEQMINDVYFNENKQFDLIVHVGDISYAGTSDKGELELIWDMFGRQVEPLSNHIPYMVTVGNHEKYYNFTSYKHRFTTPFSQWPYNPNIKVDNDIGVFYYSYDYHLIHFVSMCTEDYIHSYAPGSPQYEWISNDLKSVDRTKTPWVIMLGHRPMYSSDEATDSGPLQQYIEPLLVEYKVDIMLTGHMHSIERTYPVINYTVIGNYSRHVMYDPKATIHFVIGTAGAMISEKFVEPQPSWSVYRNGTLLESPNVYGYSIFTIYNKTHLYYEFTNQKHEHILDYVWIIKEY